MPEDQGGHDPWRQEAVQMQKDDPELTISQIAARLNKPVKTVKSALANARKKEALAKSEKGSQGYSKEGRNDNDKANLLPYQIAPIPGKGLGLVATRKICRGELIVQEKPVLTASGGLVGFALKQLQTQFDQLSSSVQDEIMVLYDKHAPDGVGKTLSGVFSTNALPQGVGSPDAALCLVISRANHSCISNAYHGWVDGRERLYCDTDIESGEEICTNYIQWHRTTIQRQDALQAQFGFLCGCPACMEEETLRKKHDAIRCQIGELDEAIPELAFSPSKAVALVEKVLGLYEQLGRPVPHAAEQRHCYDAFQLSLSEGNMQAAKRWIRRAYNASVVTDGMTSPGTLRFQRFMKNPMSRMQDGPCV
ncbi:unnamed protein product [Durusdinium trenchii]|uniref:Uncharacterized protein n=2 Tax=Durusdinium trenchii TaxID=1381693 RepID=A0ABP0T0P4_9DINO